MTSEKRAQKFHTDDASLPSGTTNQKHYPDLSSDASSRAVLEQSPVAPGA